jgi:hypothetical protein
MYVLGWSCKSGSLPDLKAIQILCFNIIVVSIFSQKWRIKSRTHLGAEGYARASNLVNKSGSEPQLECTPCKSGSNPCLTTLYAISNARIPTRVEERDSDPQHANMFSRHIYRWTIPPPQNSNVWDKKVVLTSTFPHRTENSKFII